MATSFTSLPTTATSVTASDIFGGDISGTTAKITAGNLRKAFFGLNAADPLNCGPLTATGNSTVTGTLGGISTLTCTTIVCSTITGSISVPEITTSGTITLTAAVCRILPGVTSFAIRNNADSADNLGVADNGDVTVRARLFLPNAIAKIVPGVTSLSLRNNADTLDNLILTDAGAATIRAGLTVTAGNLTFGAAAAKVIPGATSFVFRNNADSQNNLSILDNGDSTFDRGNLTLTLGGLTLTSAGSVISIGGTQAVSARKTGYTNAWTGAAANLATGYDASTISLPQLAARVRALQESLTAHGLIGV